MAAKLPLLYTHVMGSHGFPGWFWTALDKFKSLKTRTDRPVKAPCRGPVTLSIHVQPRPGDAYNNARLALCWDLVPAVNAELKALAAAGAEWIQVDEPSAAIVPGQAPEYVKMFNACVEGVKAKIGYHVCFGNLLSRPRGKRSYRWMFPALKAAKCDQFVFEYANREMAEIEDWKELGVDREVACGVVDVKSFYMEPADEVAERIALCAKYIPVEKLSVVPDCGFFPVPRWVAFEKLKRLTAGTALARNRR